jgi:hypothetical protein
VDVLEDALAVGFGGDAEVLLHLLVPGAGQFLDVQLPLDEGAVDLTPEDDVHVVGQLVGFHSNEVLGVDPVRGLVGLLGGEVVVAVEVFLERRQELLPERLRAADVVLPEPGLGLVDAHPGLAQRGAVLLLAQAELVGGVAELVDRRRQGVHRV